MGTHSDGYVEQELLTTFVTCEGDLSDPQFNTKFARLLKQLQKLLLKDPGQYLGVVKVEPWNSVRVTFTVPKEAALRLRQLAQQGDATLSQLGILSVQLEGDQAISLRIAGRVGGESREIVLRTSATTSADNSGEGGSSSSSSGGNLGTTDAAAFDHLISKSAPASTAGTTASLIKTMTQVTTAAMSAFKSPAVQSGSGLNSGLSFGCVMTTPSAAGAAPANKTITTKNTTLPHSYHSPFVSTSASPSGAGGSHHQQTAIVENSHRFSLPPPPYPNAALVKQQQQATPKSTLRTVTATTADDLLTGGLPSTTNASPANVALSSPLLVNLLQNDGVPNSNKIAAAAAASSSSSSASQDKHRLKQSSSSPHIKTTVVLPSSLASATATGGGIVARRKDTDAIAPDTGTGGVSGEIQQQVIQRIQRAATGASLAASSENNNLTMVTNVRIPVVECPTVTNPPMSCTSNNQAANTTDMACAASSSAAGNGKLPTMNHLTTVTANVKQTYTSQSPVVNMFQRQVVAAVTAATSAVSKTAPTTTLINNQLANRITYSHNDNQLVTLAGHQSPHPQAKFGVRVINVQQQQQQQPTTQQQLFHQSQQQQLLQKQLLQQQQQQQQLQQQQQHQILQYQQQPQQQQQFIVSGNGSQQQHAKSVILQQNVVASGASKMGFVGGRMVTLASSSSPQQHQLQRQQQQQQLNELTNDAGLFNASANDLVESVVDILGAAVSADSTTGAKLDQASLGQMQSNNMVQFVKSFALSASQQQQQQQMSSMAAKLNSTPKLNNAAYNVLSSGLPTGYHNAVVTSTNAAFNQSMGENQFDSIDGSDLFATTVATTSAANGTTILTAPQQQQQQKVYQNTALHHPVAGVVNQQQQVQYNTQQQHMLAQGQQHQLPPQYSSRYVVATDTTTTMKGLLGEQMKSMAPPSVSAAAAVPQQPPPPPYSSSSSVGGTTTSSVSGGGSNVTASSSSSSSEKEPQFLINPLTGEMEPMPNEGSDNEESDNQTTDIFNSLPPSVAQNDDSCFSFSPPSSAATPVASSIASNEKSSSMLFSDDNDDDSSRMSSPAARKTVTTSEDDSNSGSGDIKPTMSFSGEGFVNSTTGRHRILTTSGAASAAGSGSGTEKSEIKIRLKLGKNEPLSGSGTYKVDVLNTTNKKVDKPTSIVKPMPRVLTTVPASQSGQQQTATNTTTVDEPRVPPIRLSLRGKNFGFVKKNKKWSDESKEPPSTIPADETLLEKKSYFKNKLSPNEIVADDASIDMCGGKSPASGTAIIAKLSSLNSDDTEELKVRSTAKTRKSSAVVTTAAAIACDPAAVAIDELQQSAGVVAGGENLSNEISSSAYNVMLPAVRTFPTEAEVTSILRSVPTDAPNKMSLSCVKIKKKERGKKIFPRDRSSMSSVLSDDSTDTFTRVINETKCSLSSQSSRGNKSKSNGSSLLKSVMKSTAAKEARMMNLANRNLEKRLTAAGQDNIPAVIGGKAGSVQGHQRRSSADMSYTVAITTTTFTNAKTSQRSSASAAGAAAAAASAASASSSSSDSSASSFSGASQQFVPSSPHSANNLYSSCGLNSGNSNNGSSNNSNVGSSSGSGNAANSSIKDNNGGGKKFVVNNATTATSAAATAATTTTTKKIANNCKTTTTTLATSSLKSGATSLGQSTGAAAVEMRKEFLANHDTSTSKKSNFIKKTASIDQIDAVKQQTVVVNCMQQVESSAACSATATSTGVAILPTTNLELSEKAMKQRLLEDVSASFGEPQRKKQRLDHSSGAAGGETILRNGPVLDRLITTGQKDANSGNGTSTEVVGTGIGGESPSSGANSEHTNNQGEDSGIESMDALSEKSPNQGESPCRKEEKDGHGDTTNALTSAGSATAAANQREKNTSNAYCDKPNTSDSYGAGGSQSSSDKTLVVDNDISNVPIVTSSCNSVAAKMITTSSLVLANCLETSSSPGIADPASVAEKDDKTSYERDDTMSPDLDDVQPFRVTPALYTYSNPEKMRVDSPSPVLEDITDDISLSPKPVVILEQPKTSTRLKRKRKEVHDPMFVTTEKTKSSPGKSLLEQLLIDIPSDGGVEIRRTGMSTRNTRSQLKGLSQPSPDTLSMCSTSSSSSIKTPKCSPVPRSSDDTPSKPSPRPSSRLTSRRSRKGSESSNVSNGDETVTYGRIGKRKCSENSSSEITKGCIGFEDQNGKKVAISANTSIEAFRTSISENNVGGTPTVVVSSTKTNVTRSSTGAINKRMNNLVGDVTQSTPTRHVGKKRKGIGDTPVNRKSNYNKSNDNELALIQVAAGSEREELVTEQSVNVTSTTTPRGNNRLSTSNVNNSAGAAATSKQTTPASTSRRSVRQNHITRRRKSPAAASADAAEAKNTPATAASLTNSGGAGGNTSSGTLTANNNNNNNNNNTNKNNNVKPGAGPASTAGNGSNAGIAPAAAPSGTDHCKNVNNDKNGSVNMVKIETKSISKLNCVTKKEIVSQITTNSNNSSTTNNITDTKMTSTSATAAASAAAAAATTTTATANHSTTASSPSSSASTATGATVGANTTSATSSTITNATISTASGTAATTITTSTVTTRGNSVKQTQHLINDSAIAAPPQDISHTHTVPVSEEVINTRRKTRSVANSNVSDELTNKRRRNSRDGK